MESFVLRRVLHLKYGLSQVPGEVVCPPAEAGHFGLPPFTLDRIGVSFTFGVKQNCMNDSQLNVDSPLSPNSCMPSNNH